MTDELFDVISVNLMPSALTMHLLVNVTVSSFDEFVRSMSSFVR